jgi:hypothetical protein
MFIGRLWSIGAVAMLGATSAAKLTFPARGGPRVEAGARDSVTQERAYAVAVAAIADSAIHRLDFFPVRAQLRVQTAFLAPSSDLPVPFDDLAARSAAVAEEIDAAVERLSSVSVPADLKRLNAQLLGALKDATGASASLTTAAHACQFAIGSVERCQGPFSAASSRLSASYKRYVEARARIRAQVLDTDTHLAEFRRP